MSLHFPYHMRQEKNGGSFHSCFFLKSSQFCISDILLILKILRLDLNEYFGEVSEVTMCPTLPKRVLVYACYN